MTTIQPGAYAVNGQRVRVDVTPQGRPVLSRYDPDTNAMRVLEGEERARWLRALRVDDAEATVTPMEG